MFTWLQSADAALFRFLNQSLSNPLFDWLMPILSGNKLFVPMVLVAATTLIWKQRTKGALCVAFILLVVALGDPLIINSIKHAVARPRPFVPMPESITLVGRTASFSLPSAHAANMAAAAMVAFLFFRRSWRFMVPLAAAVAFSRVDNGVHYVSDVLIGATLGAGYAAGMVWALDRCWQWAGRKWFPLWWEALPTLCGFAANPPNKPSALAKPTSPATEAAPPVAVLARGWAMRFRTTCLLMVGRAHDQRHGPPTTAAVQLSAFNLQLLNLHWLRLGYVVIAVLFLARLAYIGSSTIELSEDEAYQWQWSKHPALAYYSKPPGIAIAQWIGTHLWGDTAFGVRFLAPCVTALMSLLLLRFFAREATAKLGLFVVLAATATPLLSVGAVLMTVDCLSVLFWTLAMLSGWQAVRSTDAHVRSSESRTWASALRPWLWTGLWLALGFLSKNTNAFQLLCFALFFVLWKPARAQLRTPGPWLALGITALAVLPQLIWNAQHGWATVEHLHNRAGLAQAWKFTPNYLIDFLAAELALLNPAFLALIFGALATTAQFRAGDLQSPSVAPSSTADGDCKLPARHAVLRLFLVCMGLPLMLGYFLYTLRARVQPNWIVPAVIPLLCLAALQADACWRRGIRSVRAWFIAGLALGLPLVILLHDTNLTGKLFGTPLPPKLDPLNRVRGWKALAETVEAERQKVIAAEGKPVFLIGAHYGLTSLLSFYIPEAKAGVPHAPIVFYQSSEKPENQYGFWPSYGTRLGATAIYVQQLKKGAQPEPPPARLAAEFTRIEDLGTREVQYRGRPSHTVRLLLCRELRELPAKPAHARE